MACLLYYTWLYRAFLVCIVVKYCQQEPVLLTSRVRQGQTEIFPVEKCRHHDHLLVCSINMGPLGILLAPHVATIILKKGSVLVLVQIGVSLCILTLKF
jgi:hypothetical protein